MVWWNDLGSKCLRAWEISLKFLQTLCEAPLWYAKSYQSHMVRRLENLIDICYLSLHWVLSNCCDPCENSFHAFMIKIHIHANILLAMLSWEVALYHLSVPKNKAPHYVLISLSLSPSLLQKRHGYRKKYMDTWRSKKKRKRKDSYVHKRVKVEREDHAKWSYNKSDCNNLHPFWA
jgi:hypothetical protein